MHNSRLFAHRLQKRFTVWTVLPNGGNGARHQWFWLLCDVDCVMFIHAHTGRRSFTVTACKAGFVSSKKPEAGVAYFVLSAADGSCPGPGAEYRV
jgi:hypothetical protein